MSAASRYAVELSALSASVRFHDPDDAAVEAEIRRIAIELGHDPDAVRSDLEERVALDGEMLAHERADDGGG